MKLYQQMKSGDNSASWNDQPAQPVQQAAPSNGAINRDQLLSFVRQIFQSLEAQGHGDKKLIEVLSDLPFTVSQIKVMLR